MFKTRILNQYRLPYEVRGCLAISNKLCVVLGCAAGNTGRFLLLKSGAIDILDYQIPTLKFEHFNYRGALYKTDTGFGCVLENTLVEYDISKASFTTSSIKGSLAVNDSKQDTGPLGTAFKINRKEILVPMEDHFYKFKSRYFTKLKVGFTGVRRNPFLFSMTRATSGVQMDCSATFINNTIVFHRCEYLKMLEQSAIDTSELCKLENGEIQVISEVSKGIGRFSSDGQHLLIKTYSKPYSLEFYTLEGHKLCDVPLTPKKVIGEIDKRYLLFFDKFDDKLWMGRNGVVTETMIQSS